MAGHRDTTISISVGSQVEGLNVNEDLVDAIWGSNATEDAVARSMREALVNTVVFLHFLKQGGSLAQSQQVVAANSGVTN